MNQTIKKINEERVLFFDIEDVRRSKELDIDSREFELFRKKTRKRDTDEYLSNDEVLSEYSKKAALKMGYTKIVSIGVGFIKDGELHIKALDGEEGDIVRQFCVIAQSFDYVCGANIVAFDLPMLSLNGLRYFDVSEILPDRFITNGKKPWDLKAVIDLTDIFKGTHYANSTLDEMCYHFGLPSPKTNLEGSQVSEEYWTNGVEKISEYVKEDVLASVNVFRKMRFQEPFLNFIDKNSSPKEVPLLERLYQSNLFTPEIKEQLQQELAKQDLTPEDKNNIKKIILAHYQTKKDKVAVKKEKESEVDKFIQTL